MRSWTIAFAIATWAVACAETTPANVDRSPADASLDATSGDAAAEAGALQGAFGEPCSLDEDCEQGFFCLRGPSGKAAFCSKTCPADSSAACTGAPEGSAAYCIVTDVNEAGDKGCAFVCELGGVSYACPGELRCQSNDDPPGSGQIVCLP